MAKSNSKWIDGLRPEGPVSKAARKTLRRRLRTVWDALAATVEQGEEVPENVHQLRVATRRGRAAMHGYGELLPRRKAAWIEKQLKRVRRAAGEARDLDVMIERLGDRTYADRLQPLVERLRELRDGAQKPIVNVYRKLRKRDFPHRVKCMLRKIHAPRHGREATFLAWARLGLSRNVDAFFAAGCVDLNDITALHQFRIEGKQLRYAMEYFGAAFGPEVREQLYPEIERVQGLLGMVNDHASAVEFFEGRRADWDDAEIAALLDVVIADEQAGLAETRQEFSRWWTPQRAGDLKRRFAEILQLPSREEVA